MDVQGRLVVEGTKYDNQKPRWSLFPRGTLKAVLGVLEYGAQKYEPDNWQKLEDGKRRYYDAAMRHIGAWWDDGEVLDKESGLPHLAHAACCLLYLLWFDGKAKMVERDVLNSLETKYRVSEDRWPERFYVAHVPHGFYAIEYHPLYDPTTEHWGDMIQCIELCDTEEEAFDVIEGWLKEIESV